MLKSIVIIENSGYNGIFQEFIILLTKKDVLIGFSQNLSFFKGYKVIFPEFIVLLTKKRCFNRIFPELLNF